MHWRRHYDDIARTQQNLMGSSRQLTSSQLQLYAIREIVSKQARSYTFLSNKASKTLKLGRKHSESSNQDVGQLQQGGPGLMSLDSKSGRHRNNPGLNDAAARADLHVVTQVDNGIQCLNMPFILRL
jgi:hypothetical protein